LESRPAAISQGDSKCQCLDLPPSFSQLGRPGSNSSLTDVN
jgi:hypothetical protein